MELPITSQDPTAPSCQNASGKYDILVRAFDNGTSNGTLAYQALAPTSAQADKMVDEQLALPVTADTNDFLYQWDASHDYDPSAGMEKITATLLAINAADEDRKSVV